jgi:5-methylcytosine-specific restriction endonuclease McrA
MEKRRTPSPQEKARIIARQGGKCACKCGEDLVPGKIDFDHVLALQFGGTNDLSNFEALIRRHHKAKSNDENTRRAKADRQRAKNDGTWLNAQERHLAKILERTDQRQPTLSRKLSTP